jgi:glycosyltransferase involved in cell wall biosynthesis
LLVHHLGIAKVAHIKGRLPHKKLVSTFATADAVCQTSLGFETQGMTVYEAISVGTPVFVVDPQIAGELPTENVWLSKKPDVDAMAKSLRAMVADIRAGNTKRAVDTGEWTVLQSKLTAKWLKIYADAIAQGPKRFQI